MGEFKYFEILNIQKIIYIYGDLILKKIEKCVIISFTIALTLLLSPFVAGAVIEDSSLITGTPDEKGTGYYIQGANSGIFKQGTNEAWQLTFVDVFPFIMQYQENSTKSSRFIPISDFTKNWPKKKNATAALVITNEKGGQNSVLLSLSNPIYNEKKRTLQYSAVQVSTYNDGPLSEFIPSTGGIGLQKIGQNLLFIEYGVNNSVLSPCILTCNNNFTACNMSGNTCICTNEVNACNAKCRGQNPPPPLPCPFNPKT